MKKIALFFGAFAMLAFASCNKEEGMVKLTVEGEPYASSDKQEYQDNRVYFTSGDQIWVNGELSSMSVSGNGSRATLTAQYNSNGYDLVYGNGVNYSNGAYKATYGINMNSIIPIDGRTTLPSENTRPWVLYSFMHDVDDVNTNYTGHNHFMLKNAVSFIAPGIKYGRWWANYMWSPTGTEAGSDAVDVWPAYSNDGEMPVLKLVGVEVISNFGENSIPLTGVATLNPSNYDWPEMEMAISNIAQDNRVRVTCRDANGNLGIVAPIYESTGDNGKTLGMIPVCPDYTVGHTAIVKFMLQATLNGEVRNYIYRSGFTIDRRITLYRGLRLVLMANFFNRANVSTETYRTQMVRVLAGNQYAWEVPSDF